MRALLLLPLLLLLLLLSLAVAQSGAICAPLFADLVRFCGPLSAARPELCCPVLRRFNDAYCWCQPVALSLATKLASNQYAFALRLDACAVPNPRTPSFSSRDAPPTENTCPSYYRSHDPTNRAEGCNKPVSLRKARINALFALDHLDLTDASPAAAAELRATLRKLFVKWPIFASIGLTSTFGLDHITQALLSRQSALGAEHAWTLPFARSSMTRAFWRGATVSYDRTFAGIEGSSRTRSMFVGFEHCSTKIVEAYAIEEGVLRYFADQFFYPADPPDAISMYDRTPEDVCATITKACADMSPYESKAECRKFMAGLKSEKKVFCSRVDEAETAVFALMGDTLACRYSYALAAKADPQMYCPLIGKDAGGMCVDSVCRAEYDDVFANHDIRYEGSDSFSCDLETGNCVGSWPA